MFPINSLPDKRLCLWSDRIFVIRRNFVLLTVRAVKLFFHELLKLKCSFLQKSPWQPWFLCGWSIRNNWTRGVASLGLQIRCSEWVFKWLTDSLDWPSNALTKIWHQTSCQGSNYQRENITKLTSRESLESLASKQWSDWLNEEK